MKGGLACALLAMRDLLAAIGEAGQLLQCSCALVCTVDEEDFMRGVEAAIKAGWFGSTGWVLDCEPTDGYIRQAHKGRTWFELTMRGTTASMRRLCEKAIAHPEKEVLGTTGSLACTGDRPPLETHPDSPLLAALSQAIKTATGAVPQMGIFTGHTDSAVVAGLCHNKNCMSYGPGSLELAHKPNEYVPTEDLACVRAVLSELLEKTAMRSTC